MSEAVQEILQRIQQLPEEDRQLLEERLAQLGEASQPRQSQAGLLADLRRRSYTPPAGTPESDEMLRQDRGR